MSMHKKEFDGQLPSGERTANYSEYKSHWNEFTSKIEKLLNAECYINSDLFDQEFIATKSRTSGEKFNLPVWAAKRMLGGDYILDEHNVDKMALSSKEEIEKKLLDACNQNNTERVKVILENDSVQEKIDAKTINKILGLACYIDRPEIVEFITSHKKLSKEVDMNSDSVAHSFTVACMDGYMKAVKSIIKNVKTPIDKNLFTRGIDGACHKGKLKMVRYLLETPELKNYLDMKELKSCIQDSCQYYTDKEITDYLSQGILKDLKVKKIKM